MPESCQTSPAIDCSFYLFQHGNTIVEINLVGALLPLVFSLLIIVFYRRRFHGLRAAAFSVIGFLLITAVGSIESLVYGTISTPGWVFILYWLLMIFLYSRLRVVRDEVLLVAGELYVVGTLSVLFDDLVRTLLGFMNVPFIGLTITPNIWGAGGPFDGIFMTGVYQALLYMMIASVMLLRGKAP